MHIPSRVVVLASGSPRRSELLTQMGIPFEVIAADVDEQCTGTPQEQVCTLALRKAMAVQPFHKERIILAADTLVHKGNQTLGKPQTPAQARDMLQLLSGAWHEVYTGVCLINGAGGKHSVAFEMTRVRFSHLSDQMIDAYVRTGEPMDKAGAYAIQGRGGMFVEEIQGSPSNVIGLPMALVHSMFLKFGIDVF